MSFGSTNTSPRDDTTPSSEYSTPSISTAPLLMSQKTEPAEDETPLTRRASTGTVAPSRPNTTSTGTGGCWTCRLRRKKCDEQREGDACATCRRLEIECLGWGSRRPEWMRDKEAVNKYKADIKEQLLLAGRVRGQPRPRLPLRTNSTPSVMYHPYGVSPGAAGPGPRTLAARGAERTQRDRFLPLASEFHSPEQPYTLPNISSRRTTHSPTAVSGMPMAPEVFDEPATHHSGLTFDPSFSLPHPSTSSLSSSQSMPHLTYDPYGLPIQEHETSSSGLHLPYDFPSASSASHSSASSIPSPAPATMTEAPNPTDYALYYFEHVHSLQFPFADRSAADVLYSVVVQDPNGIVSSAVCALAAFHYASAHQPPYDVTRMQTAKYFCDQSSRTLSTARPHYTETHALAALTLVSGAALSAGAIDWRRPLAAAGDWLQSSGLLDDERPRETLATWAPSAQLAVKLTIWYDIVGSITEMQQPRHLELARALLNRPGYFAPSGPAHILHMEKLCGYQDQLVLALAEVSALAAWKDAERLQSSLSMRALVRKGDEVEALLRAHMHHETPPAEGSTLGLGTEATPAQVGPSEEKRRLFSSIFREAISLHLHTVLSDSHPDVPDIKAAVRMMVQLLEQEPASGDDRILAFPLTVAACLTDDLAMREALRHRLESASVVGNVLQARGVVEGMWTKRDIHRLAHDWRTGLRSPPSWVLLV